MKIGLRFREYLTRLSPLLVQELDSLISVLQVWSAKEHNSDGTHGRIRSLECESIVNDTGLAAGTYTPTITAVANCTIGGGYSAQYLRVGNTVTVSGKCDIDPTSATTLTQVGISLPVASNFSAEEHCAGVAATSGVTGYSGRIVADGTNDRAELQFVTATDVSNVGWSFHFTYQVI